MEQKIIKLVADDYTRKTIAEKLFFCPKTIEHHCSNICKKLNRSAKKRFIAACFSK